VGDRVAAGDLVLARVVGTEGVDLVADFVAVLDRAGAVGPGGLVPPGVLAGTRP